MKKAGPSGNSRPRLPEPRAPAGDPGASAPRERAAVSSRQRQRSWSGGAQRRGLQWAGGAGRGEGARAGSGQPAPRRSLF